MGLDTVEIVLRTKEVFGISLPDEQCGRVVTVGDLYRLVLRKLDLPYVSGHEVEANDLGFCRFKPPIRCFLHKTAEFPVEPDAHTSPWTAPDVWLTLQAIIVDQLQAKVTEVREEASFLRDLGCE